MSARAQNCVYIFGKKKKNAPAEPVVTKEELLKIKEELSKYVRK